MENNTFLFSSLPYGRESALRMTAFLDPKLIAFFLLFYFFLGLASYTWAFWSQRSRLKAFKEATISSFLGQHGSLRGVQNIHSTLFALFFIDSAHAITAVILAIDFARSTCQLTCVYVFIAWYLSRCIGVALHLLHALMCLLFLFNPQWGAKLRCVYTLVALLMLVFIPCYIYVTQLAIFGMGTVTIGLACAIIAKCTISDPSPAAATRKKPIVLVAMLTFLIVYTPAFILQCLTYSAVNHGEPVDNFYINYLNAQFGTSFHLFMDGLLCYFILKLPSEEEEQQQQQQQEQQLQDQSFDNQNFC